MTTDLESIESALNTWNKLASTLEIALKEKSEW